MKAFARPALVLMLLAWLRPAPPAQALDPATLPVAGYHPNGIAYYQSPYFADGLRDGGGWLEFSSSDWGSGVALWNNPQFDANGFPQYLNPGKKLRGICYGLHVDYSKRPATWPKRSGLAQGHIVLAWKGDADIRLPRGTFLSGESSGAATGRLVDGRRVYRFSGSACLESLEVHDINSAAPVTDIKVWLADPAAPDTRSLEGQLFHPALLARLAEADWGYLRFMDWAITNGNPQQDWGDRRPPTHAFMAGGLNPRAPATGASGNRATGVAYEYMVALCNAAGKDLWINVPHLATDDFIRKLALLIRYGSDGTEPYDHAVANPVYAPLDPARRVFIEYSNEIWSNGGSFPQGDWAQAQASALGISKAQFNARRFCQAWRIFQEVFGGTERLGRVAAVFTANQSYTDPFLREMKSYGPTLSPAVEPDAIAVTTYFGNGIQDWVYQKAQAQAGTTDPWFLTSATFDAGGGVMRPVALPAADPYWSSEAFKRHQLETFAEWRRRLLSGDAREGAGPDAVGIGGGFDDWLADLARTTFAAPKPIIAYEGGPSLYTDDKDGGDDRDDGITTFMEALNRNPEFRSVYEIHLNMARAKGLRSHMIFTDCGSWGKYGQWGHLEALDQPTSSAVKYQFILDWMARMRGLRPVDQPKGAAPGFLTSHTLPVATVGAPYAAAIDTGGGDGARMVRVVGEQMAAGLSCAAAPGRTDRVVVSGAPQAAGTGYLYLCVTDADGDPAWRTFTVRSVGGPETLLESDFSGANPSGALPWKKAYFKAEGLAVGGWTLGAGARARSGDGMLCWSVQDTAVEAQNTLTSAVQKNHYLSLSVAAPAGAALDLRGAVVRFTVRRIEYHAPRNYAVFSSVGGFAPGAQVFATARDTSSEDRIYEFRLPQGEAWRRLSGNVEFRIYGYSGQYGHKTALVDFMLGGKIGPSSKVREREWSGYR